MIDKKIQLLTDVKRLFDEVIDEVLKKGSLSRKPQKQGRYYKKRFGKSKEN